MTGVDLSADASLLSHAYRQGQRAAGMGSGLDANPFQPESPTHEAWIAGHRDWIDQHHWKIDMGRRNKA